jgi:hypothetical protein
MPPYQNEILHEKRVAVVVLRLLSSFEFAVIAEKLGLKTRAVNQLSNRALQPTKTGQQHLFVTVIENIKDGPRTDRPPRILSSSEAS